VGFGTISKRAGILFNATPVLAAAVAYGTAPLESYVSGNADLPLALAAKTNALTPPAEASARAFKNVLEEQVHHHRPLPRILQMPPVLYRTVTVTDITNRPIEPHEVFHILSAIGNTLTFNIHIPNPSSVSVGVRGARPPFCYEPAYPVDGSFQWSTYFSAAVTEISGDPGRFLLTIEPIQGISVSIPPNNTETGQLYYGAAFTNRIGDTVHDLVINDTPEGFMFRGPAETGPSLHKDTLVIHVCAVTGDHAH
jgi:hypothetical protein